MSNWIATELAKVKAWFTDESAKLKADFTALESRVAALEDAAVAEVKKVV